jgi:hypothetical protein
MHRVAGCVRSTITEPIKWQRIGKKIGAALILAGANFVNVRRDRARG